MLCTQPALMVVPPMALPSPQAKQPSPAATWETALSRGILSLWEVKSIELEQGMMDTATVKAKGVI